MRATNNLRDKLRSLRHLGIRQTLYHRLNWPFWLVHPIRNYRHVRYCRWFRVGMVVQDCRYHPCIITAVDEEDGLVDLVSLLDDSPISCDLYHCVDVIDPIAVVRTIDLYRKYGNAGLWLAVGSNNREFVKFETHWRLDVSTDPDPL